MYISIMGFVLFVLGAVEFGYPGVLRCVVLLFWLHN